ncbi:MFS transporter, partial [Piscirickettsia salmonis]|uniref:MFS transporter n=1 Tax=Piscirickettsia salmonis TaxID=1238 RepID=UPI003EB9954A
RTCNIYFVSYLVQKSDFSLSKASLYMTIVQAFVTILIPLIAYLNKISLKKTLQICTILMCISAPVLFYSAPYQSEKMLITGLILYVIANSGISAVVFAYMYNCLPTKYRCTGTSLTWNLCSTIFGSTSPIIASIFVSQDYIEIPVLYIIIMGLIVLISLNVKHRTYALTAF